MHMPGLWIIRVPIRFSFKSILLISVLNRETELSYILLLIVLCLYLSISVCVYVSVYLFACTHLYPYTGMKVSSILQ